MNDTNTQAEKSAKFNGRKEWLFIFLAGLFITNAVTAELISNKLIEIPLHFSISDYQFGPFVTIIGILPWPVVFLLTDVINEFYGQKVIRRLSWITAILIAYCFVIIVLALQIPAKEFPGSGLATGEQFNAVFGQAPWIIVGSICAFLFSQILDATLFHWIKNRTGNRMIWLRSTGSTVISQLFDSCIVLYIGFVLPGKMSFETFFEIAPVNYILKLLIAIALTPLIYLGHWGVRKYLGSSS